MIVRDDIDIFDDICATRKPESKPDYRKLQWIDVVPGLQTYVPVEIHDQTRQTTDESNEPEGEQD